MADGEDKPEFEVDQLNSRKVINLPCTKTSRAVILFGTPLLGKAKGSEELSQKYNFLPSYPKRQLHTEKTLLARESK